MTVTKTYCDRCGKEIDLDNPLEQRCFPIWEKVITFRLILGHSSERIDNRDNTLCEDCMEDFWEWFDAKGEGK